MIHIKYIFSFSPQPLELEVLLLLRMEAEIPFRKELGFSEKGDFCEAHRSLLAQYHFYLLWIAQ